MPDPIPERNPNTWAQTSVFSPWLNIPTRIIPANIGVRLFNFRGLFFEVTWYATRSPAAPITAVDAPMDKWAVL